MLASRRRFLAAASAAAVVSFAPRVPACWLRAAESPENKGPDAPAWGDGVLVVLQLTGGNDGLNTVVPYADEAYRRNRFSLAIAPSAVLKINDQLGFHPSLRGFANLLEAGRLAIVQGVGYPQPNRSHFESMDLWHSAHRQESGRRLGWLGRYLDGAATDHRHAPALHVGAEKQPLALASLRHESPSIETAERFRLETGGDPRARARCEALADAERAAGDDLLLFAQRAAQAALTSSAQVEAALARPASRAAYPSGVLAGKLRAIARLIQADLGARVYYVTQDGYDTHAEQGPAHAALLAELGGSVEAFVNDLREGGHDRRVTVFMFSEFGRRVKENASQGTDHGAAAPVFVAGGGARPGVHGAHPSLVDLDDGDLKFHTDYRRVYAALLQRRLGADATAILRGAFDPLDI